jgi:two-component sensor histidine kinase
MVNFALQPRSWVSSGARTESEAPVETAAAEGHLSRRIAVASIVYFWIFYFVINTIRMAVAEAEGQLQMLVRRLAVSIIGLAITGLLCVLLRRYDGRTMRVQITVAFLAAIPASVAYAATNYLAFYVVHPAQEELQELQKMAEHMTPLSAILDQAFSWYFFIVAWAALYIALSYAVRVRIAERNAAEYRAVAQTAQLRALRYQINPHFLFNTLNSLSTLVMRARTEEAERMIMNLSTFFRTSLTNDPTEDVALIDEIRMQRLYLDIEQVRFPDRLRVEIDVPLELESAAVPGMLLQPVVENAIKYAVARSSRPVTVAIRARDVSEHLQITVEDDGADEPVPDRPHSHGVGLRNVCDRLAARFGDRATCQYGPRSQGGFRVTLTMPLRTGAARDGE